jgi:cyclic beta-1,2-glucan synthetase
MDTNDRSDQSPAIKLAPPDDGRALKYSDIYPLRAELLSVEQMSRHGRELATSHRVDMRRGKDLLLARLAENEAVLSTTHDLILKAVEEKRPIAPASEWILDNYYLIRKQIRLTRQHFPKGYSRGLPRLSAGSSKGYPRVYDLALELIIHGDGRVDLENVTRFLEAYQGVSGLTLGELWAIPIMLRLALIENIQRVAAQIAADRVDQSGADLWADRMIEVASRDPKGVILEMADLMRSEQKMSSAFVAEFARRLQGRSPTFNLVLDMVEQQISVQGLTVKDLVRAENRKQAADQVTLSNSITSIRVLEAIDWREFVESNSIVDQILRDDPAGVYGNMDFDTRDQYRHVVERLARRSAFAEREVAEHAMELAAAAGLSGKGDARRRHVGYYLINEGLANLRIAVSARPRLGERLAAIARAAALPLYAGAILLSAALVSLAGWGLASAQGLSAWAFWPLMALLFLCASHFSVSFINWLATLIVCPEHLPRMDFSRSVPPESRTLVVIPTLLGSAEGVQSLLEGLEVRFLGNRDKNIRFGLLTDFRDASGETMPGDDELLRLARTGIEELNAKYGFERNDRFFLFHRPRRWNPREQVWMGYERKRGKLGQLNALLRGRGRENFALIAGDVDALAGTVYVITLDTDTELPRDTARALAGAMAHPLNRPLFDAKKERVVAGYTVMQPRVAAGMNGREGSWFLRLFGGDPGIDPYTRSVSDVYQDLFREGSFIGKGIYDVDAFAAALENRFPDDLILSHDLLEGCHARAGLVTDIQLIEDFPPRYVADVSRRHRWIRGDWQIAGWLLPRVPGPEGTRRPNPLTFLSRWKIFDNLRRSLVPPAMTLLYLFSWTVLDHPLAWTLLTTGFFFLTPLLLSWVSLSRKPLHIGLGLHLKWGIQSVAQNLAQVLVTVVFLPFEAFFSADAVLQTLVRLLVTRRKLLEWTLSSDSLSLARAGLAGHFRAMVFAPLLSAAAFAWIFLFRAEALAAAAPFLALWFVSPAAAWWMSRPLSPREKKITPDQADYLSRLARKTWRFFETFVGPEDHWLPPDNYQEEPAEALAGRTSPTNIGLSLLANLAACDFGYIPTGVLIERTARTLETMGKLDRFRRHFYNWYDTRTLEPLHPLYVSSVDSGNLAGHLLTLRQGLLELRDGPIVPPRLLDGLGDTLAILIEESRKEPDDRDEGAAPGFAPAVAAMKRVVMDASHGEPLRLVETRDILVRLEEEGRRFVALAGHQEEEAPTAVWAAAVRDQCTALRRDLEETAPWLDALTDPPPWEEHFLGEERELAGSLEEACSALDRPPTLREATGWHETLLPFFDSLVEQLKSRGEEESAAPLLRLREKIAEAAHRAAERIAALDKLAHTCRDMADFDYSFLFDRTRRLLAIGYNASEHRRDDSYYDLLASEARLSSFVAIAQGRLPQEHWFALGRLVTRTGGKSALISWGGSMFEYLMPLLVMPHYADTLLGQSCRAVVEHQIGYGRSLRIPWGISESGYSAIDARKNYQYRSFGVPGLGFRRDLADDIVIAPYASVLALMIAPHESTTNLMRLSHAGFEGDHGFYEAIDFTPSRRPPGQDHAVIRSYMAHHQGMSFLAIAYALLNRPMQRRFLAEPIFQATDLLLQERTPRVKPFYPHELDYPDAPVTVRPRETLLRSFKEPHTPIPEVHLLSNGSYSVMVTATGGGYSRWNNLDLTRWREDTTRDHWGTFCYLRDVEEGRVWSTAYQPVGDGADSYEAIFVQARAEFRRRDGDFDTYTQIAVSPEDDIELRRISITNRSRTPRNIELTSYAEVVLASQADDLAHPAFSNLFVETEIIREPPAVLCTRRKRSADDRAVWMLHMMTLHETDVAQPADGSPVSFETDRSKFVGRCRTPADPDALSRPGPLSDSEGSVLDPIAAIRRTVTIQPEETAVLDVVTGIAATRHEALILADKYHDHRIAERVFELAWTHAQVVLRQLNATEADAQLYGRLAGSIVYSNPAHRAPPDIIRQNRRGQPGLWGFGISGDLPIVLLRIADQANVGLVRQLIQAHAYWNTKGIPVDLVIWNEERSGYRQPLQDEIMGLVSSGTRISTESLPGSIFVKNVEHISEEDQILMQTVARVILTDEGGSFAEQVERRLAAEPAPPALEALSTYKPSPAATPEDEEEKESLDFFNGFGGFARNGREYVITCEAGRVPPAPWSNVLANPRFGTVVTESGGAYTWSENAHEYRLTPWHNDPVSDVSGEAFYIRDDESGRFWSPTPLPARGATPYTCRHGFGYTRFEHDEEGIASSLTLHVALHAPVKYMVLRLHNGSSRTRKISATGFFELVLGERRMSNAAHVITNVDPRSGAILARNYYNTEFPGRVTFVDVNHPERSFTSDRTEFLGRNGSHGNPAAMHKPRLSGKTGAAADPCAALRVDLELEPEQSSEVVFILGCARNSNEARKFIKRFRGRAAAQRSYRAVRLLWNRSLRAVQVSTPDKAVNHLANGWLLYQTLSSRIWARSGFYQSGGAYGFRDQLQDVMALIHTDPSLARAHLIRCAQRQFTEGDVLHWWHPPVGRGVRTRFSDDYLWLPLAASRYVFATGDRAVLDEEIPFIKGRPLQPEEEAYYDLPSLSAEKGTLYEHCLRAVLRGLRFGEHGLPLMGCGDWNDGMNLVGAKGKGESVWLAFFLLHVMKEFREIARLHGDEPSAERLTGAVADLAAAVEKEGWDGEWYRRAYFDDGTPLGSTANAECRIDSLPQSWAVISGSGDPARARTAMAAVDRELVDRDAQLIKLFDPPFDKTPLWPGYIKGYVPGVRENGGQYTHAAVWAVMAFAELGESRRAWELLSLINPIHHGSTAEGANLYRVEPYVVAADVYSRPPHRGRGGWTWYTGSAAWMYRLILESLLGLRIHLGKLHFSPRLHPDWEDASVSYRYRSTVYEITFLRAGTGDAVTEVTVNDTVQEDGAVTLEDDGERHTVRVTIGDVG